MTKLCKKCKNKKQHSDFHRNSRRPDGLAIQCKLCVKTHHKDWYQQNKKKVQQQHQAYTKRTREKINNLKRSLGCQKCDEKEIVCLDFHHTDDQKKDFSIADMVRKGQGWETILEEIEKCICVCSNCHRKIHAGIIV